jgi:dTDP-4-amino-4,6-dideoxygalactose transaminase
MAERKRIYLCLAHMSDEGIEQKYIKEAFDTNWVVPLGPNVNGFEADLEAFVNPSLALPEGEGKRVVALSSGTSAVHLALKACGVGPGDEVCVQLFTFCASSHPITYLGATPVFIDSEKDTWNMDPGLLEEAIKDRIAKTGKKPKAIIPVALYGMPYKIDQIMAIADKYGIPVVEDAAEGFGSKYKGQMLGTFGKYGVLSFNGNKMITTSGGGALITENEEEWREIMMYATQYRESYPYYQHEKIGYNYRMSNICAGIGRGQMTVANDHIAHHKHVQKMYEELLADVPGVHVHSQPATGEYDSNYWLCTITIDENVKVKGQENAYKTIVTGAVGGAAGVIHAAESAHTDCEPNANVEAMRVALDKAQIEARPVWKPMHKQPVYRRVENGELRTERFCGQGPQVESGELRTERLPSGAECLIYDNSVAYVNGVSEALFKVGMCLPAGPYVSDDDVRYIVDTIKANIIG